MRAPEGRGAPPPDRGLHSSPGMQHLVVRRVHAALVAVDIAVAMLLAAIGITELRSVGDDIFYRSADGLGMALVLVQTLPLAVRRLAPLVATAVVVAGSTRRRAVGS